MQSSSFIKTLRVKLIPHQAFPKLAEVFLRLTGEWKKGRTRMKKGGKGFSEKALISFACTGLLITSLGGMRAISRDMALQDELSGLKDKIPPAQMAEIESIKTGIADGYLFSDVGNWIGGAALGYLWGKKSVKKEKKPGPSR